MKLVLDIFWVAVTVGWCLFGWRLCRELRAERDQ